MDQNSSAFHIVRMIESTYRLLEILKGVYVWNVTSDCWVLWSLVVFDLVDDPTRSE